MAKKRAVRKTGKKSLPTKVEAVRHKDKRKNIPTEELRDFVRKEDQHAPPMLYPRDPSLDPQLVWKGKDDQDRQPLSVPVVPIYIQEKIHPRVIIDDLPRIEHAGDDQLDLFADFNGLPEEFDQRIDFYQHDGHWSNRMILGDSLLVMTSLAEKEGLRGQVQTIYLDPPYGIKFGSNWQVSTRKRDVKDGKTTDATRQPEQVRAFRDTWQLGIHSYLAYLRDRLVATRELLTDSGSVFVQIGDENVHLVRALMDEVFGSDNCCGLIAFKKTSGTGSFAGRTNVLSAITDYILWYAKDAERAKYRQLYRGKEIGGVAGAQYTWIENDNGQRFRATSDQLETLQLRQRIFRADQLTSQTVRVNQSTVFPVVMDDGKTFLPSGTRGWSTNVEGMARLKSAQRLLAIGNTLTYVRYLDDFPAFPLNNLWEDTVSSGFADPRVYVVQTTSRVVERCLLMTTDPGDLVLDPTCGSGTTAYVAEEWGRRWITCDTSRVALALARTRLMAAKFPYYYLADDYPHVPLAATDDEIKQHLRKSAPFASSSADVRKGFVYKRVPHVTLKSIANNPDIHEGMSRAEIDAAISRHAETETLFDQPYEDKKRVRVSGPFTVESLSPHRTISAEERKELTVDFEGRRSAKIIGPDKFGQMIIDNLRKAGVQNTVKNERLKFDSLEPHPGEWIHAEGRFTEADGKQKRAAVCIGPEFGSVEPALVKEAAKEAVRGVGFDVLIVCGFAFDPHVSEEAKRYGNLVVLPCRMNPDLAMGDELLKKTGAGNLFMVFGEPDIEVKGAGDQVTVEIRGLDVYDPTTGEIRSSSTDDIACWFIDTSYNGESFFVRHAYFTGADQPYEKLKRALRAEIDEDAWAQLYSTTSRPFPKPETGKFAIKVINHYGDEVLKVYDV